MNELIDASTAAGSLLAGLETRVAALEAAGTFDPSALEAADAALDARLTTAEAAIDAVEATDATQDGRLSTAESDIDALEAEDSTQNAAISGQGVRLTDAEAELADHESRITTLEGAPGGGTDITVTHTATTAVVASSTGADGTIVAADDSIAGLMLPADKAAITDHEDRIAALEGAPAGGGPTRPAIDSGHVIVWAFDEANDAAIPNDGGGGALSLTQYAYSLKPVTTGGGPWGKCSEKEQYTMWTTGGSPAIDIPTSFAIEAWFRLNYYTGGPWQAFNKNYAFNSWSDPWVVAHVGVYDYRIDGGVTTGAGFTRLGNGRGGVPRVALLPVGVWAYVALRWNNSTKVASLFYQGQLIDEVTLGTTLARNANAGQWAVGGRFNGDWTESGYGAIAEVRVTDMSIQSRSDSYFADVWAAGTGR